jgi:hypothetical protein
MNINNKEQLNKIELCWCELLNLGSMQNLLNFDRKDKDEKKWMNDKMANNCCKEYLAHQDET